jgi:transposase
MENSLINSMYEDLLNLSGVKIIKLVIKNNIITIDCYVDKLVSICPHCSGECSVVNKKTTRRLRDLSISNRTVYLMVTIRQFYCPKCDKHHAERLDFADSSKSYTHRQAQFIFELCQKQSYKEIGAIVDMHSKTVERLVLSHCERTLNLPLRYARLRRLGIDEQSHRKGKKDFICLLTDLDTGTIVDILPNRKKETLIAHFQSLGLEFCQQITDVSCDIWQPYISAIEECFPTATLVLDRFHVVKLLNDSLDAYRKELRKIFKEEPVFKKIKWLLFKQYHTLTDNQIDELQAAFKVNPLLEVLYFTREKFHHILDKAPDTKTALTLLDKWRDEIKDKKITAFDSFLKTLGNWKEYMANYVKNFLSNAVTEGLNNLIRSIRRCAFGMPNFKHLRLRVMAISSPST